MSIEDIAAIFTLFGAGLMTWSTYKLGYNSGWNRAMHQQRQIMQKHGGPKP